jgi:hypothetical protein
MESAEIISAEQGGASPAKRSSSISVLPEAVEPKSRTSGIGGTGGMALLFFQTEFDLPGKNLIGRKGNYLAVIQLYFRILQHGKLIGTAGRSGGNFVHITIVLDQFF